MPLQIDDPEVFRSVLESLPAAVYIVDLDRRIVFWNRGAEKISGHLSQDVLGRCCRDAILVHCDENSSILCGDRCPLQDCMLNGARRTADIYLRHKSGHRIAVHVETRPIRNQHGTIIGASECFWERRYVPDQDRRQSEAPALDQNTGMPSHNLMEVQVRRSLEDFAAQGLQSCIIRLQVDDLEPFREARGREAVEVMLQSIAQTLKHILRPTDVLGHWAGEGEYLAVVRNCRPNHLKNIGLRLQRMVSRTAITWWGDQVSVTLSIGGTAVVSGDTMDSLLARTERALAECKDKGGNCVTTVCEESTI